MAHQRTIDTLLCMSHTPESKAEMIAEFRRQFHDNASVLIDIDSFENAYHSHGAVRWYTHDSFVWRSVNQALRLSDINMMFKLRYILTDLYTHLNESYRQAHWFLPLTIVDRFYRGQLMSINEFDSFKELRGSTISINTFLSTTKSMQIALMFAGEYHKDSDFVSVVFNIEANQEEQIRPYANISLYSLFQDEEETLFAMGSVFHVGNIRPLANVDNVWVIYLKTIGKNDPRFTKSVSVNF